MSYSQDDKRLAKNAFFMYVRMAITMLVGLYTSRVVLRVLGVEDYGLQNVIGGIIAMFAVLNSALVNTTSRFITVSLAKDDTQDTRQIFNMTLLMHFMVGLLLVVLGETVGLWYLHTKLVIPEGREIAAEWLYQITVISAFLSTLMVPFNAAIVAHEKLNVYALLQIVDVFLKLGIVFLLQVVSFDKLIFYSGLTFIVTILDFIVYYVYCHTRFLEIKFMFFWDWSIFRDIIRFIGWALVGNFSSMFYTQGINLMLNAFCGPAVNAARGIAVQVELVVKQFANNVQVSINPQILKSHSVGDLTRMHSLVCASSRYCFYLLFLITLPIMFEAEFILHLWLGQVPEHTVNFIRLILIVVLLDAFINPMFTANLATGKLNTYYIPVFSCSFSFMFITYFAIKQTRVPESVFLCYLLLNILGVVVRVFVMNKQIRLTPLTYMKKVVSPTLLVTVLSVIPPLLCHNLIRGDWMRFTITIFVSFLSILIFVYYVGITNNEKSFAVQYIRTKVKAVFKCNN